MPVPVPLPFESFEIKFGCHHYTTPNTHINTTRTHAHTHKQTQTQMCTHTNRKSKREKVKVKRINSENGRRSCCALRLLLFSSILLSHHVRSEYVFIVCAYNTGPYFYSMFNRIHSIEFISFRLRVIRFLYVWISKVLPHLPILYIINLRIFAFVGKWHSDDAESERDRQNLCKWQRMTAIIMMMMTSKNDICFFLQFVFSISCRLLFSG